MRNSLEIQNRHANIYHSIPNSRVESGRVFEECNRIDHLRQYYFIREYAYRLDLGLRRFSGAEDEFDSKSQIFIGRDQHFVYCGARLTISHHSNEALPHEYGSFRLRDAIPELQGTTIAELSRATVLPTYRDASALKNLLTLAIQEAEMQRAHYMIGATQLPTARRFARTFKALGYKAKIYETPRPPHAEIHEHLNLRFITVKLGGYYDQ